MTATSHTNHKSGNRRLYNLLIKPRQSLQNLRNREIVLNIVLVGTGLLMSALLVLLLISLFSLGNTQVVGRIIVAVGGVLFIAWLLWLSRRLHYRTAAYLLTLFYLLLAGGSVFAWGIGNSFGILLLGMVIILASTILSARHALYTAGLASLIVFGAQASVEAGWITLPEAISTPSSMGDAFGSSVVFAMLAIISWLFGARMEGSLIDTEAAEKALEREKSLLQVRLRRYTEQLRRAQMDEMRQLYQFAEIGQLSTSLLHDLANYLTVLNIEIDGIRGKQQTEALGRSRAIVSQLDTMLDEVRDRLAGIKTEKPYNLTDVISETIERCRQNKPNSRVTVEWQPPRDITPYETQGDPIKCGQIISILINNAYDSYPEQTQKTDAPRIRVSLRKSGKHIRISITDWGSGIPADKRSEIFKPAYSTKHSGMGIGLYLANQMVMTEFSGSLTLTDTRSKTEFVIALPSDVA